MLGGQRGQHPPWKEHDSAWILEGGSTDTGGTWGSPGLSVKPLGSRPGPLSRPSPAITIEGPGPLRGQGAQAAGEACRSCMSPEPVWYQRCAASCSQHPSTQCQPCSCIPGRTPGRCLSTASPRHPPRCQVRGFLGKKSLTNFLTYISQLSVSFTIYENPQEWPNRVSPTTRRGPSLCLFCLNPWIFFHQLTRSYRNWLLLTVF